MLNPGIGPRLFPVAATCVLLAIGGGMSEEQHAGVIVRTFENDRPVVFKFVDEWPEQSTREAYPWLTVVSWTYDGSANNGMPARNVNDRMIQLERALETSPSLGSIASTGGNMSEMPG